MIGTADGPFAINVYGMDLDQSTGDRARMTGMASIESQHATIFRLDAAAVVERFPPGDYNCDGIVDAADYDVWRKNPGCIYNPDEFNTWRAHFGQTIAAGMGASAKTTVPKPATFVLLLTGMLSMYSCGHAVMS